MFTVLGFLAACGGQVGDGDGDGRTSEQLIDEYCDDMVRLGCTDSGTEAECRQSGNEAYGEAAADGCAAEFDTVLRCATSEELTCTRDATQACPSEVTQFEECQGEASGGSGGSGGEEECSQFAGFGTDAGTDTVSCGRACATYASECTGPSQLGPLTCSCTEGPNLGATFEVSDCSTGFIDASEAACQ